MKNKVLPLIGVVLFCFLIHSCSPTLRIAESSKNIGIDIAIEWTISPSASELFISKIDSVMNLVINLVNQEDHGFYVHKKRDNEEAQLTLDFEKIKFVSTGGQIAGYLVSGVGLIASPIIISTLTNQAFTLVFWYFPHDCISYSATLSADLDEDNRSRTINRFVDSGVLFTSKSKRTDKISRRLKSSLYRVLLGLNGEVPKVKKWTERE